MQVTKVSVCTMGATLRCQPCPSFKETTMALLRALPGFVSFQMVYGENDMVTAIALYTSESAAHEANDKVVPMVRDVFAPLLAGPVEPSTGMLIINAKRE